MNSALTGHTGMLWIKWPLGLTLLALGVWLRVWQINHQILIDDEWHAIHKLMFAQGYSEIFLSFGEADYSIPLTLLFRLLADTLGLSEWSMRALPLAFGISTMVALLPVFRPWLRPSETWLFVGFMAISPLLIYFSRLARPYALTIPLGAIAVVSLWRWWYERHRGWAFLFVCSTTLCAWLHPLTLLFTGGALAWFATLAFWHWHHGRGANALVRIALLGNLTVALCALLVLPPLIADPGALMTKAGIHALQWPTFVAAWELMIGCAEPFTATLMLLLAGLGAIRLARRDRLFAAYWLTIAALSIAAIALLKPAWIHHALVLARYIAILLPVLLVLATLGVYELADHLTLAVSENVRYTLTTILAIALLSALYFFGPLRVINHGINQFVTDTRYHFDYDFDRSIYKKIMVNAKLPEIYRLMMDEPGEWKLIETPWQFASYINPFPEYQRQHKMPIKIGMISGLCSDWRIGELRPIYSQKIRFDQFIFINDILQKNQYDENFFLVFHIDSPFTSPALDIPPIGACIEAFRSRFGNPWHEDKNLIVFRIPAK